MTIELLRGKGGTTSSGMIFWQIWHWAEICRCYLATIFLHPEGQGSQQTWLDLFLCVQRMWRKVVFALSRGRLDWLTLLFSCGTRGAVVKMKRGSACDVDSSLKQHRLREEQNKHGPPVNSDWLSHSSWNENQIIQLYTLAEGVNWMYKINSLTK